MVAEMHDDVDIQDLPRKRLSGKRIVLFIVLPLLLLSVGGAAVYFSGVLDFLSGTKVAEAPPPDQAAGCVATFQDMPEILVNLTSTGARRQSYMKLRVSLELCRIEDRAKVVELQSRVVDNLQVYLRELRLEDLRGSAGFQRLREELRYRIAIAVQPVQVKDVLFQEVLVQ